MNNRQMMELMADRIEAMLATHRVPVHVTGGTLTPRWVQFNVTPAQGVRLSRITGLSEELAAALDAPACRVQRRGATVAVEVPRRDPHVVRLGSLGLDEEEIPPVTAVLGLAEDGAPLLIRLTSPDVAHILVAGTTGSGKTALLRTMILTLAQYNPPADLALVLIDPKGAALAPFSGLPHLARPVIRESLEAAEALASAVRLMERRPVRRRGDPAIVLVIDELADVLMTAGETVCAALTRLAQRGREAGLHIVAATQKPTAAVLGPLMKANFPTRLVGRVTSIEDARVAAGWSGTGAERLTGNGDFIAIAEGRMLRFQAAYASEGELLRELAARGWEPKPQPVPVQMATEPEDVLPQIEPEPEPNPVAELADRLAAAGWEPEDSYRSAARALGEAEGGRRFALVQEAVERYRATATTRKHTSGDKCTGAGACAAGSGSTVAFRLPEWKLL